MVLFIGLYPKAKSIDQKLMVMHVQSFDNYHRYRVSSGLYTYHLNSKQTFAVGDILEVKGDVERYRKQTVPGGFDGFTYWLGQGISGSIQIKHLKLAHASNIPQFKLAQTPIFDLFEDQVLIETNWMSHLFKLSSIHLTFLIALMMKLLYYLDIDNKNKYLIVSIAMACIYFIAYSIIVLRMMIKYGIQFINDKFELNLDKLNIECLTFLILISIKPFIIYNQSFLVIYVLVFLMQLRNYKSTVLNIVCVPMIIAPFLLYWHQEVSLISLCLIPIIAVILKYLWTPTLLLASILPFFKIIDRFKDIIVRIEYFLLNYDITIYFIQLKGVMWVLYFMLVIYVFSSPNSKAFYKRMTMYISLCFMSTLLTFLPKVDSVTFLDVGQGDSAVIFKNNQVIVVDAFQNVTTFLKYNYVYKIDYLIITHPDIDHSKELKDILNTFKVEQLILNAYHDYDILYPNTYYVGENNLDVLNDVSLRILGPIIDLKDTNENSVVFQIEVAGLMYLFTGDIGIKSEKLYIEKYGHSLRSDVIKVPHHGSLTSSSDAFLDVVKPYIAVISVGTRNMYHLPNELVINRYRHLGIYMHRTDILGSLKIQNNKMKNFPP